MSYRYRPARCLIIFLLTLVVCGDTFINPTRAQQTSNTNAQRKRRVLVVPTPQPASPPSTSSTDPQTSATQPPPSSTKDEPEVSSEDVVRVETDLASVLLLAVDKNNKFVTTLKREDLRIFENNAPQELSIFQRETDLPLSLVILVDASESQKGVLKDEKIAAETFVDAVIRPDKDRAAVISFTGRPTLEQGLTGDALNLKRAINRLEIILPPEQDENAPNGNAASSKTDSDDDAVGGTGVWDAIWASVSDALSGTPEQTRRAIILLSDGDDTTSFTKRQEAIDFAVQHNVVVYSIGIRDESFSEGKLDTNALRKVSEKTGGRAFFPHDKAELLVAFAQIQQELRSQYLVAYSPVNKTRDASYRQVRIEIVNPELRKQKLRLLYRQGYYARQPSTSTPKRGG